MAAYVAGRLLRAIPLLLGLSILVFALIHAAPGGPLTVYLSNPNVRPEDIARLERLLGLDRPLHEQYLGWLSAFLTGDWGFSYVDGRPVLDRVLERAGGTLELMGTAFLLALTVALALGSLAALRPKSLVDSLVSGASMVGISLPTFWLGLVLQLVFAVELRLLPTAGRMAIGGEGRLAHLVLPAVTLASFYAASWIRYIRSSLASTLSRDFVRAGRGRGINEPTLLFRHSLPNALFPLVTVLALDFALLFSGAVVTETVFAWPGMGTLLVDSVYRRDYSVLMAILMVGSAAVVLSNLAADVIYGWLDPRVRVARKAVP
ncbi:MAG TPA: ABC transporter permease [Vicinamibacteria bacterium]|nr:ABC transporter permease [Vicinamibacteria bacterium]